MSLMAQTPTTLFPSIGSVADQTDNLETRETSGNPTLSTNDNEEKVVQEVESLCMKCDEQVSLIFFFLSLVISNKVSDFFSRELRVFSLHPYHFSEKWSSCLSVANTVDLRIMRYKQPELLDVRSFIFNPDCDSITNSLPSPKKKHSGRHAIYAPTPLSWWSESTNRSERLVRGLHSWIRINPSSN